MSKGARASALIAMFAAACGGQTGTPSPGARADFIDANGKEIGHAALIQRGDGVLVVTALHSLPAGDHGFHVHAVGRCEAPFQTAGAHHNPAGKKHGLQNPEGPHAGDLTNLVVGSTGTVQQDRLIAGVTLASLFDEDGSALVVHAAPDDYKTDPAGNAGARIACGVIRRP